MNDFKYSIEIPVPIGGTVWTFWTDCCGACWTKHERAEEIKCNVSAPCHTMITSVQPVVLKYSNLEMVLEGWGTKFFFEKSDAEDAADELIRKHRARMKELGYELDDEGGIVNFKEKLRDDDDE